MESFIKRARVMAGLLLVSAWAVAQVPPGLSPTDPYAQRAQAMERLMKAHERAGAAARTVLGMSADQLNPDELEAQLADRVPGFAGWVHRADGVSLMRLVPQGGANVGTGARGVLESSPAAKTLAAATQSQVEARPALWDSRQLLDYKRKVFAQGASAGLVSVHIDRAANRVEAKYDDSLDAAAIEALADRILGSGVPRAALVLKPGQPYEAFAAVGTSVQRQPLPLAGGSRFRYTIREGEFICTVGLPVRRGNVQGFVTASHCSQAPFNVFARTQMRSDAGQYVGMETVDPLRFECQLNVPLGCRNADAQFVAGGPGNAVDFGKVLETPSNSLTVSAVRPIVGSVNYPALGSQVFKTGQTTGTRSSEVVATCVDAVVTTPQARFDFQRFGVLCATVAQRFPNGVEFGGPGDSGSPIWVPSGSGALIAGLLSYGNDNFIGFSPWGQVIVDMGPLTVR